MSDKQLTEPETKILSRGLNFAPTPKNIPTDEIITTIESACNRLNNSDSVQCKGKIAVAIKAHKIKHRNITKEENEALKDLQKYHNIII